MKSKSALILIICLSLSFCASASFGQESYTITKVQIKALSENLTTLKELVLSLRQKLDNYKNQLHLTAQELQASQLQLLKAETESNTFILTLKKQEMRLQEQSSSLINVNKSLKKLRQKEKIKNIFFTAIVGYLVIKK